MIDSTQRYFELNGYRFTLTDGDGTLIFLEMHCAFENHLDMHVYRIEAEQTKDGLWEWFWRWESPEKLAQENTPKNYEVSLEFAVDGAMRHSIGECAANMEIISPTDTYSLRLRQKEMLFTWGIPEHLYEYLDDDTNS